MSRSQTFSVAWFGKKRPFEPGIVQEYSLQGVSEDFPADALQKFQRVVRRFRWDPCPTSEGGSSSSRFEPCIGIWSLPENRWLLVRFTDDGQDDRQRPHLLGAAAIVFDAAASKDPKGDLLGIATSAQWPAPPAGCEGSAPPIHLTWHSPDSAMLSQWRPAAADTEQPQVIFCSTQHTFHYEADPSENVFMLGRQGGTFQQASHRPSEAFENPPAQLPDSSRRPPWLTILSLVGMAVAIGSSVYLKRENSQLAARLNELEKRLADADVDIEKKKQEIQGLQEKAGKIARLNARIQDLEKDKQQLEKDNERLKNGLTAEDKQATERYDRVRAAIDELLAMRDTMNEKLNAILNALKRSDDDSP